VRRSTAATSTGMVLRIAKAAGIPRHISPHTLRHAAITNALDAGVPLRDAQILARHADPRTTEHYDRARGNLDRHGVHFLTAYVAGVNSDRPAWCTCFNSAQNGSARRRSSTGIAENSAVPGWEPLIGTCWPPSWPARYVPRRLGAAHIEISSTTSSDCGPHATPTGSPSLRATAVTGADARNGSRHPCNLHAQPHGRSRGAPA